MIEENEAGDERGNRVLAERLLADCDSLIERDGNDAHALRAQLLFGLGRPQEALAGYEHALRLDPGNSEYHEERGRILLSRCDHAGAVDEFAAAIDLDGDDTAKYHAGQGFGLMALGRYDAALACYDKALRLDPDNAGYHSLRGLCLAPRKRKEALAAFDRAAQLEPDDAGHHFNRALTLFELGRHDEALAACRRALECDPGRADCHALTGDCLLTLKRDEEALASFDRAARLEPDDAHQWFGIALSLAEYGYRDEALARCRRAIELDPGNDNFRDWHQLMLDEASS